MKRPKHLRRWLLGALASGAIIAVLVTTLSSGGPLESAGDDGYLGLRLLLTERGATVSEVDADEITKDTVDDFDVVFVMTPAGVDRTQLGSWHQYVAAGGRLILGQPDAPRPTDADRPPPAMVVEPGACDLDGGDGLDAIHTNGDSPHHVYSNEQSCFGNGTAALVTSATCRDGVQVTLASPSLFDNSTMGAPTDDRNSPDARGNAELAARIFATSGRPRIGIVTGGVTPGFGTAAGGASNEPDCGGVYDDDALWQVPGDPGRDVGEDGTRGSLPDGSLPNDLPDSSGGQGDAGDPGDRSENPPPDDSTGERGEGSDGDEQESTEAGTAKPPPTIFDFLSPGVKLALAQLLAVLLWFAWRRSRRDGVVVEDETPVELRSSRLVEAVAALRRRGGETERAGEELRDHTRRHIAASLGLAPTSSVEEIATALGARSGTIAGPSRAEVMTLLGGRPVSSEDELVALAERLRALREHLKPAGASTSPRPPDSGDFTA